MYDTTTTTTTGTRRGWVHLGVKLHMRRFGGGLWRVCDRHTGLTLGYAERTPNGWLARSKSRTYQTTHRTLVSAVHALASYGRMKACSLKQERFAKVTRAHCEADAHKTLAGPQLEAFRTFIETHPKAQLAGWWCSHNKVIRHWGWEGFKAALKQDGLAPAFMRIYRALGGVETKPQRRVRVDVTRPNPARSGLARVRVVA